MNDAYLFQQTVREHRSFIYKKLLLCIKNREKAIDVVESIIERLNTDYLRTGENGNIEQLIDQVIKDLFDGPDPSISSSKHFKI